MRKDVGAGIRSNFASPHEKGRWKNRTPMSYSPIPLFSRQLGRHCPAPSSMPPLGFEPSIPSLKGRSIPRQLERHYRDDTNRTCDLSDPNRALYQAELRLVYGGSARIRTENAYTRLVYGQVPSRVGVASIMRSQKRSHGCRGWIRTNIELGNNEVHDRHAARHRWRMVAPDQRLELCKYGFWKPTRAPRIRRGGETPLHAILWCIHEHMSFSKGVLKQAYRSTLYIGVNDGTRTHLNRLHKPAPRPLRYRSP